MNRNDCLFDDISRVLASSIPRRQALRLVAGGIGGVILNAVWPSRFAYAEGSRCGLLCLPTLPCDDPRLMCVDSKDFFPYPECCSSRCNVAEPQMCCCEDQDCCGTKGTWCCDSKTQRCCGDTTCCDAKTEGCCVDANGKKGCVPCIKDGGGCNDDCECCNNPCSKCEDGTCVRNVTAKITSWHAGPPTQIQMTFRDPAEGLATVSVVKACNVTVDIPSFEPGTKDPVVATLTKIDWRQPAHFALKGCCTCQECCTTRDPVATTLKLNTGRWARQRFGNIGEAEYFVSVENGHPGLQELTVQMNEKRFELRGLSDGEERNLNVSSAMIPGNHNVVILTGRGEVGASATIMISDTRAQTGLLGASAAEIPGSRLSSGVEGRRAHPNMVWGELVEEEEETGHLAFAEFSGQTVQLTFGGRIDIHSASEPSRYEAEVNGSLVRVESVDAHLEADSTTITLRLAGSKLRTGDDVTVFWDELLNDTGHSVSGRVGPLVVRSLQ